jgi:hydrogenase expression/formation protein HypE
MDLTHIQLAHGGGGQLTAELVEQVILPAVGVRKTSQKGRTQVLGQLTDAATLSLRSGRIAFTTDSYVVQPLEFPGGDIGRLAVCGTVNDLAVVGAAPVALSLGLVLEEGMEIATLRRILESAARAAREAGVEIVTGDTKVVERGGVAGMILNTAGVGQLLAKAKLGFRRIRRGDRIVLSGPLGEHGLAILCQRKGLSIAAELKSDCAPLSGLTKELVRRLGGEVRFMRDPTRGGLAATLVEAAGACRRDLEIEEAALPLNKTARAASEMLGLDLLTVANEGKLVAIISADAAQEAVAILARHSISAKAAVIGTIGQSSDDPLVEMATRFGGRRIVQMPYGEELPRIC